MKKVLIIHDIDTKEGYAGIAGVFIMPKDFTEDDESKLNTEFSKYFIGEEEKDNCDPDISESQYYVEWLKTKGYKTIDFIVG